MEFPKGCGTLFQHVEDFLANFVPNDLFVKVDFIYHRTLSNSRFEEKVEIVVTLSSGELVSITCNPHMGDPGEFSYRFFFGMSLEDGENMRLLCLDDKTDVGRMLKNGDSPLMSRSAGEERVSWIVSDGMSKVFFRTYLHMKFGG